MYKLRHDKAFFKKVLKKYNTNQVKIAQKSGYDRSYICQVMNGRLTTKKCAIAICNAIGVDINLNDIFEEK